MVINLRMTQPIDTQSVCPSLDMSFSSGDSATPSPSSSISHHGTPFDSSIAWCQDLSSRSPVPPPQFVGSSSSKHDSIMPDMEVLMPHADYTCTNMLDGMAFLGDGSDLIDCHQVLIAHGLPAVSTGLDGTHYRLTPYEYPFQPSMPSLGLDTGGLPASLLTPECSPCFSQPIFSGAETPSGCPPHLEADPYLTPSTDSLPQTVVPSQIIQEPMTPCSGRGPGRRGPLKAEESNTPMDLLMEFEALMKSTPDHSPATTSNPRMSALRWDKRPVNASPAPLGRPRSLRTTKRGPAMIRKTLDERTPLRVESGNFHCTHPKCNVAGHKKKSFGRREHLKRHETSVHSGLRPFYCKHCEIHFSRSDNYNSHRETHTHKNRKNGRNRYIEEVDIDLKNKKDTKRLKQPRRRLSEYN